METLVFSAVALVVVGAAWSVLRRGRVVTDEVQKAVAVQQDVRAVVEYMSRDVAAAYWFGHGGGGSDPRCARCLVLVKYASSDVGARLGRNTRKDYPYSRLPDKVAGPRLVNNWIDSVRVTYTYDAARQVVLRKEEKGFFALGTDAVDAYYLAVAYDWEPDPGSPPVERVLGANVKDFALHYFGYERSEDPLHGPGLLKEVWDLQHVAGFGDAVKIGQTACILLKTRLRWEEGVYADGGGHRAPEVELCTKIWSNGKLRDEVYHEYFSSVDWDLRF